MYTLIEHLRYYLILLALPLAMSACKDFSFSSYIKGDALAVVGDAELYPEDVASVFTPGMNPEDSVKLLRSYVDRWIMQQLKIQRAERLFSEDDSRIEKMVEDYRNSLLIYEYEKQYVDQRMDTVVTPEEVAKYYTDNAEEFRLTAPLVRGFLVKVPVGFRQEAKLRELARSGKEESYQDFMDICLKSGLEYREFPRWTDYSVVVGALPRLSEEDYKRLQQERGFYETQEGDYRYFLVTTVLLREGTPVPLELALPNVRTLILNRRRQEMLRQMEDSIYNAALHDKEVRVNVDKP